MRGVVGDCAAGGERRRNGRRNGRARRASQRACASSQPPITPPRRVPPSLQPRMELGGDPPVGRRARRRGERTPLTHRVSPTVESSRTLTSIGEPYAPNRPSRLKSAPLKNLGARLETAPLPLPSATFRAHGDGAANAVNLSRGFECESVQWWRPRISQSIRRRPFWRFDRTDSTAPGESCCRPPCSLSRRRSTRRAGARSSGQRRTTRS